MSRQQSHTAYADVTVDLPPRRRALRPRPERRRLRLLRHPLSQNIATTVPPENASHMRQESIFGNETCYTGWQVWNRQPTEHDLIDPANIGLGQRLVQRWKLLDG